MENFEIRIAEVKDVPTILKFIQKLAEYEKLSHEVTATEELLRDSLFGNKKSAEVVIGFLDNIPVGFALFFHNYSTFLAQKGIYLEDLFVLEEYRGKGFGKKLLQHLAKIAVKRNCGRVEWAVLDWNEPAINFYNSIGAEMKNDWRINRLTGKALLNFAK